MRCGNSGNGRRSQRGHKVLRKQSKAYDKKLSLVEDDTTSLPQTHSLQPSQHETQKSRAAQEDNPPLSAFDERLQALLKNREPSQKISFVVSHRKFTSKA